MCPETDTTFTFLTFRHAKRNFYKRLCSSQREYVLESGDLALSEWAFLCPTTQGNLVCFCGFSFGFVFSTGYECYEILKTMSTGPAHSCVMLPMTCPGAWFFYVLWGKHLRNFWQYKITHWICISILEGKEFDHAYKMFHLCEHEHLL